MKSNVVSIAENVGTSVCIYQFHLFDDALRRMSLALDMANFDLWGKLFWSWSTKSDLIHYFSTFPQNYIKWISMQLTFCLFK